MKPIILGTGASEAIPCVFCDCDICNHARVHKDENVRTRSSFLIDEYSIIDFSPDLFYQTLKCGISLSKLRNIFITHFHEDHLSVEGMSCRMSATPCPNTMVNIYCTAPVAQQINLLFQRFTDHNYEKPYDYFQKYQLRKIEPFKTYKIENLTVTPILSSHHGYGINEIGMNYIIKPENQGSFLYAVDTGWYDDETWKFLEGKSVDYLIMECTYGDQKLPQQAAEHLNIDNAIAILNKMYEIKFISMDTPIYLTHICHLNTLKHNEMQDFLDGYGFNIIVGYDGMVIDE